MKSKTIVVYALMSALVTVATFAIRIPMVATDGYLNIGDGLILFCGVVFGPLAGFISGGIGSALADLIAGYAHWILPTLIIKGAEGALAGFLFWALKKVLPKKFISAGIASLPAAIVMVVGYFFASWIMKGSAAVAFTSVPGNAAQGGVGIALALLLLIATSPIKGFSSLIGKNQFYDNKKGSSDEAVAEDDPQDSSEK